MTENSGCKKSVRARMAQTGENYTTARRHLLARQAGQLITPVGDNRGLLADDEPTVLGTFLDALLIQLPPEHARATSAAAEAFRETGRTRTQQWAQFYALLNRAYRVWCADAVQATGRGAMHEGL